MQSSQLKYAVITIGKDWTVYAVQQAQIPKKQTEVWNEPAECHTPAADKNQTKESPPERAYTLRPAGKGEPVDTLPER